MDKTGRRLIECFSIKFAGVIANLQRLWSCGNSRNAPLMLLSMCLYILCTVCWATSCRALVDVFEVFYTCAIPHVNSPFHLSKSGSRNASANVTII